MDEVMFREIVHRFNLVNDYTENPNIWVGHSRIGSLGCPNVQEAREILIKYFGEPVIENGLTPEWIKDTLKQWENFHPFQHIREDDQPLFVKKIDNERIVVAVIWPWQMKKGIASLMIYEGKLVSREESQNNF